MALGRTNATSLRTSRTVDEIVRANVLTVFNGVLVTLFVLVVATGRWQNGLVAGSSSSTPRSGSSRSCGPSGPSTGWRC